MAHFRLATAADVSTIFALMKELAAFEGGVPRSTEEDLRRDGFGINPLFEVLLAEDGLGPLGMLVFFPVYSTWEGRPGLMIHDLFVRERGRGQGVGRSLIQELARLALARGCTRLDVTVLDWNEDARRFYTACGLVHDQGWLRHRADAQAIAALATGKKGDGR